jgi:hypothetical protein
MLFIKLFISKMACEVIVKFQSQTLTRFHLISTLIFITNINIILPANLPILTHPSKLHPIPPIIVSLSFGKVLLDQIIDGLQIIKWLPGRWRLFPFDQKLISSLGVLSMGDYIVDNAILGVGEHWRKVYIKWENIRSNV